MTSAQRAAERGLWPTSCGSSAPRISSWCARLAAGPADKGAAMTALSERLRAWRESQRFVCCLCGAECMGYGNNLYPLVDDEASRCCDACNGPRHRRARPAPPRAGGDSDHDHGRRDGARNLESRASGLDRTRVSRCSRRAGKRAPAARPGAASRGQSPPPTARLCDACTNRRLNAVASSDERMQ